MSGMNPAVKPGIIALNHKKFIYAIGNNIVIHNIADKTQKYLPVTEGAEGFSFFAISPCQKYLVVCEKAKQALCSIYELSSLKRKRRLTSQDLGATEFVSISFAETDDKLQ